MMIPKTPKPSTLSAIALLGVAGAMFATAAIADRGPGLGDPDAHRMPFANFDQIDADKDGKITKAEVDAFRKAELAATDTNGDGFLVPQELAAMHLKKMTERADDMAAKMIERMDADADGKLSLAEMAAPQKQMTLFERVDTDKDGAITKAEADAATERMAERMAEHHVKHKRKHHGPAD